MICPSHADSLPDSRSGLGRLDMISHLVESRADCNLQTGSGWSAMFEAAATGNSELISLLISMGYAHTIYCWLMHTAHYAQMHLLCCSDAFTVLLRCIYCAAQMHLLCCSDAFTVLLRCMYCAAQMHLLCSASGVQSTRRARLVAQR